MRFAYRFLSSIILLSFSLTAVAPKLSARTGLASEAGETFVVCLCVTHLLLTHTLKICHTASLLFLAGGGGQVQRNAGPQ